MADVDNLAPTDSYSLYLQDYSSAPDADSKIQVGNNYYDSLQNGTPYIPKFPLQAAAQSLSNVGDSLQVGLHSIGQGATAGLSKYYDAYNLLGVPHPVTGEPMNWNDALDAVQWQQDHDKATHPAMYYGGNIVGGLGAAAATGGGSAGIEGLTAAGLPLAGSQMVRAAATGAGYGGIGGFTENRGMDTAGEDTTQGALLGGSAGGLLSATGSLIKSGIQSQAGQYLANSINDLLKNKPAGWNQKINDILTQFSRVKNPDMPPPVSPMGPDVLGMANDMSEMSPALRTPTNLNAAAQKNGFKDFNDYADNGSHDDVISMAKSIPSTSNKTLIQDNQGNPLQLSVSENQPAYNPKGPPNILVEAHDINGTRQGFADFSQRADGALTPSLVRVRPDFRRRGIATAMYQNIRDKGYDIAPGKVQTRKGAELSQNLVSKGIVNKEPEGIIFDAGTHDIQDSPNIEAPFQMTEEQALNHIRREMTPPAPNRPVLESEMNFTHKQLMNQYIKNLLSNTQGNFDYAPTQAANRFAADILNRPGLGPLVQAATRMSPNKIVPGVFNSSSLPSTVPVSLDPTQSRLRNFINRNFQ